MVNLNVYDNILVINDNKYSLEKRLVKKLIKIDKRITNEKRKWDAFVANEGKEGEGKTNDSLIEAAWMSAKTKREIHLFFRLEPMINFAKSTIKKIIIWDEPALDSLSTDQLKTLNRDLLRLVMTSRIKQHFIIVNLTKFNKFPEYLVVDRLLFMLHTYTRAGKHGKPEQSGRFMHIGRKNLENMWNDYAKTHKRLYNKYKSYGGWMPNIIDRHFNSLGVHINGKIATIEDYNREKEASIQAINEIKGKKELKIERDMNILRYKVSQLTKKMNITQAKLGKLLGVSKRTIQEWAYLG